MNAAGLRLTTIDVDPVKICYPSAAHLIEHLRSMGESNALKARAPLQRYVFGCGRPLVYVSHEVAKYVYVLSRDIALAASAIYDQMFSNPEEEGGGIYATFQVVYLIGWKASKNQPKEAARGSATVSLKDLDSLLANDATSKDPPSKD